MSLFFLARTSALVARLRSRFRAVVRRDAVEREMLDERSEAAIPLVVEGTAPGYFAFHNTVMLRGRDLVPTDTAGQDMSVVIENGLPR